VILARICRPDPSKNSISAPGRRRKTRLICAEASPVIVTRRAAIRSGGT
jgi:hypothetical protein